MRCVRGAILDVIVDLRPDSPTLKRSFGVDLDEESRTRALHPQGHGARLPHADRGAEVLYLISTPYVPDAARGVRWDDPAFGIDWPAVEARSCPTAIARTPTSSREPRPGHRRDRLHRPAALAPLREPASRCTRRARRRTRAARSCWHACRPADRGHAGALIARSQPTHLLHLAWNAEPGRYWTTPENLAWAQASFALYRAFAEAGGRRAVGAGTCAEYDWSTRLPRGRDAAAPRHALRAAKRRSARAVRLRRAHGPSTAWGRVFFLYGPGEHPAGSSPAVIRAPARRRARRGHARPSGARLHARRRRRGRRSPRSSRARTCTGR